MLEAIREALWEEMERDPDVFIMGEDIGAYGGAFKVTDGFLDQLRREAGGGHAHQRGRASRAPPRVPPTWGCVRWWRCSSWTS
jgi:hypothetical protein